MDTTNSHADDELARKLERIFQIFASAQEEWVMAHIPDKTPGDREADVNTST